MAEILSCLKYWYIYLSNKSVSQNYLPFQAVQQVLRQQQPNGHHAPPAAASSPPQIPKSATTVQRPPQLPPLPPPTSKRQAPLDSTTTTEPDDSVSLSSLSQPASSHSQKSLLNKSAVVSEVINLEKIGARS